MKILFILAPHYRNEGTAMFSPMHNLGAGGPGYEIGPDANNDHPMAPLRYAEFFRADDKVRGLRRFLQSGLPTLHPDCPKFILMTTAFSKRRKVLHKHLEDEAAFNCRGKHAFDIFHHECSGSKLVEYPDVLAKQVVPLIVFRQILLI